MAKRCKETGDSLPRILYTSQTVVWLGILLIAVQTHAQPKNGVPPNLIVILCDNLGYGDISPFGSQTNNTPGLARMAREGKKFTHFYASAGVCTPSRASIMTGCYAQRVGMHWNPRDGQVLRPISPYGLNPAEITIAEVLRERGYATGMIGKWHLGDQAPFLPNAQGFEYFYGIPYSDDMTPDVGRRLGQKFDGNDWPPLPLMLNEKVIEAGVDRSLLTGDYTEKAVAFIEQNKHHPFFLFLSHAMPGSTSTPFASERFKGKSLGGAWGDSVEELDWSVEQILNKLVEEGLDRNTLVIFTSDNGAPMTDDPQRADLGTNKPLNGRGYTTSEGGFRVPTIMWWPGTIRDGTVCDELATTMDFLPTFALLAGASLPADLMIDGHDIYPLITGKRNARSPYEVFYYYEADQLQAIRRGPWKLFLPLNDFRRHPHFKSADGSKPLLFNVVEDVSSTSNVADQFPHVVRRLMSLAESARADLGDADRAGANQRRPGVVTNPAPVTQATYPGK